MLKLKMITIMCIFIIVCGSENGDCNVFFALFSSHKQFLK